MATYTRHLEVPVYEYRQSQLDADIYNAVRLGLKRIEQQIRIPLAGLKTLDLILQEDAWIVVDHVLNDIPVIAWTDFKRLEHDSLSKPIQCQIRLFHSHAAMLLDGVLYEAQRQMKAMIQQDGEHKVLLFPIHNGLG
jgi:hypothetical protein